MLKRSFLLLGFCVLAVASVLGQANGKLQIHFMDVGQGDGAVLISPKGEVVLFDDGRQGQCPKPVAYLQSIGVTKVDYHIASHYHLDHIGCAKEVFQIAPLQKTAYDRGGSYASTPYTNYIQAVGTKRQTVTDNTVITLDAGSANPVVIKIVAFDGNGVVTTNENDLSVVAVVSFDGFKAEIGGDLSGEKALDYEDIETSVAPKVGQVDVYKVHHHCSAYSTNTNWLTTVQPRIGIVSVGVQADGNTYHHPTEDCLDRLHNSGVRLYWTEKGEGLPPDPATDVVAGTVVVQVAPNAANYTVSYGTQTDTYAVWTPLPGATTTTTGGGTTPTPATRQYAWSKKSNVYHYAECKVVKSIKPENLEKGTTPPAGKTLHQLCPQ
jgi:beta-lactamase superfamily II metal-dependent hydrolase